MRKIIYYLGVALFLFLCGKVVQNYYKKPEANVVQPVSDGLLRPSQPDQKGVRLSKDTILEIGQYRLEFSESSEEEYNKYAVDLFAERAFKGQGLVPIEMFIPKALNFPKKLFNKHILPLIDWNKKLDVFFQTEKVWTETYKTYIGDYYSIDSSETDENDDIYATHKDDTDFNMEVGWFILQKYQILKETYFDRPDTNTLVLKLSKGRTQQYINDSNDQLYYRFLGYSIDLNAYFIAEKSPERRRVLIVNKDGNYAFRTWDIPDFVNESVHKLNILPVISKALPYEKQKRNGLQLFSVDKSAVLTPWLEFEIKYSTPEEIVFVDANNAILMVNEIPEGCPSYGYYHIKIVEK